ncbi:MAG: GNAT family N-acetyltransferase [Oscillospiraceae bacterium]|nr:GNAT family N-acetyltransferase [Oscillospiraceae bacterium]MBQ7817075.1 GNAT family N-acetyltransferase [Oscillospiraceae bacterium]
MYHLFTDRLILTLSHPRLAQAVCRFNRENRAALADTEPMRPKEYYTYSGVRSILREEDKASRKCEEFRFWIRKKGSDEVIGTVCISNVLFGSVKSCYLSYKISANQQGNGYATEAVKEVINFAFTILQLHRIESYVMPRNAKSLRVMEKLNFEPEGISKRCLEVNGVWEDHVRFSLLNE